METTSCTVPHSAEKFLHGLATTEKLALDGLKYDYYDCRGLTQKSSDVDVAHIISKFPLMIVLLIYCLLLPIIGLASCSLKLARRSQVKLETRKTRRIRICCYVLLLLLLALLSYCVWLILRSTNCPLSPIVTRHRILENQNHAHNLEMINSAFKQDLPPDEDYFKLSPENFYNLTNQPNHVAIKQLYPNSQSVLPLIEGIRDDLYLLISNLMEFIDSIRFFNRNTTNYLSSGTFYFGDADFFLLQEMRVGAQQLKQLFCMKQLIENIIEIFKSIVATDHLRESALISIRKSHDRFADYVDDLWEPNAAELNIHRRSMYKALLHLHTLPSENVFFLPSQMHKSAIAAFVVVSLIISLIVLLLCGEMILMFTKKGKGCTKCLLISVIGAIFFSSFILGYIMALHFAFGVIVNNFQRSMNLPTDSCFDDTDVYCQAFDSVYRLYERNFEEDKVIKRNKFMSDVMSQEIGNYKQSMTTVWTNPYHQKMQLSTKVNDCEMNFLDRNFFTTVLEELSIDDLNMTLERFTAINDASHPPILEPREMKMCNLEVLKKRILGRLLSDNTTKLVLSLSEDAQLLASRQPKNWGPLLQQAQIEVSELQFMYINELKETLKPFATLLADVYAEKLEKLKESAMSLPDCVMIRTSQLGMPLSQYHQMEDMEHCVWIGILLVLFLLSPLLVIILVLLHFHNKRFVVTSTNIGGLPPVPRERPMVIFKESDVVVDIPSYDSDDSSETEERSSSQPTTSRPVKGKQALKVQHVRGAAKPSEQTKVAMVMQSMCGRTKKRSRRASKKPKKKSQTA